MISLSRRAVLTFNASDIVKLLRRLGEPLPTCLVDIGDGLKLNSGLSRDDGGEPHWNVWEVMKPFFRNISDCAACVRLAESRAQFPEPDELNRLLSEACLALRALWKSLEIKLIANQEYKRFVDVEIPVQQIFFARQYAGIYLDSGVVQQVMQQVQNDKYTAFREVAAALNASPSGLSFRTIGPFLQKTDASHLSEFSGQSNFEDYFRIAQSSSTFAAAFLLYMRASRDLTILRHHRSGGFNISSIQVFRNRHGTNFGCKSATSRTSEEVSGSNHDRTRQSASISRLWSVRGGNIGFIRW